MRSLPLLFVFATLLVFAYGNAIPEQIHLALAGDKTQIVVMWATNDTADSVVQYTSGNGVVNSATGTSDYYFFPDVPPYTSPSFHTVTLTGLQPGTKYQYRCGSSVAWSDYFYFVTESDEKANGPVVIASIADHGVSPNSSDILNSLVAARDIYNFDFLVHAGDISYANGIQHWWDYWGRMVEPFASQTPWMVAVGNHELLDLYLAYQYRFTMPYANSNGPEENLFYSYDYGLVHYIALNSEELEFWHFLSQYSWLENDLKSVDKNKTPWIVASWHDPWYCSNHAHYGSGDSMRDSYEDLFFQYGVDLVLNGHVHAYERTQQIYQSNFNNKGTIYITNGLGGNNEGIAKGWYDPQPSWSVVRDSSGWGFGVLTFFNASSMHWKMIRAHDNFIIDEFYHNK